LFKSGFITIIGSTNVGKSSLLNNLINKKISITSQKSQTTRNQIMGICNHENYQLIFIDNPGINLKKKIPKNQKNIVFKNIEEINIILFVVDQQYQNKDQKILEKLNKYNKKIFLIINKIDIFKKKILIDKIIISYLNHFKFDEIIPLSCLTKKNINNLKEKVLSYLKEGPLYFSKNTLTNITKKELIEDFIREKIFYYVHKEIPYQCNFVLENIYFNQEKKKNEIFVLILVKKNSQKKILIGEKGKKIKKIGIDARIDIYKNLNMKVYLHLWVKIDKKNKLNIYN
jgi:GTP-binding protein Era